jgi:hypothetical protein
LLHAKEWEGRRGEENVSSLLKANLFIIHHLPLLELIKHEYMNSWKKLCSIIDDVDNGLQCNTRARHSEGCVGGFGFEAKRMKALVVWETFTSHPATALNLYIFSWQ